MPASLTFYSDNKNNRVQPPLFFFVFFFFAALAYKSFNAIALKLCPIQMYKQQKKTKEDS